MKKISLFFIFALVLFFITIGGTATGETFASVDLYISGQPNGQLRIEEPSGINPIGSGIKRIAASKAV